MNDDLDFGGVDVFVSLDEVGGDDGSEQLWRRDWILFGEHIDGVLCGISSDDNTVIGLGIAGSVNRIARLAGHYSSYEVSMSP